MKIGIGNDHSALELKAEIIEFLKEKGHEVVDYGTYTTDSCDYPVYGEKVARAVVAGEVEKGILICGTGLGISLAANKVKGIRACVCSEPFTAKMSRAHNDCNVLAFGARVVGGEVEKGILICGTGLGISLAANKVKGIRACVCSEPFTAKMSRAHNDCNVLAFGARVVGGELAKMIVDTWINTEFEGGRHQRRVDLLMEIEERN